MVTILIADDELLVRSGIKFAIGEMELPLSVVGEANNGAAAMDLLRLKKPDIVITDIKMPLINGLDLIRQANEELENVPQFIIVSGYADFEYAKQAMQYGVFYYVLKPIKAGELREALQGCTARFSFPKSDSGSARALISYIDTNYNRNISLEELSAKFCFSMKHTAALVKKHTGKSFTDYLADLRMETAFALLLKTEMKVKEIAAYVGYEDPQYFHRVFKQKTGQTPAQYREK